MEHMNWKCIIVVTALVAFSPAVLNAASPKASDAIDQINKCKQAVNVMERYLHDLYSGSLAMIIKDWEKESKKLKKEGDNITLTATQKEFQGELGLVYKSYNNYLDKCEKIEKLLKKKMKSE
jgi:hypothetical protein